MLVSSSTAEVSQTATVSGRTPSPCRRPRPVATSPAATSRRTADVTAKNVGTQVGQGTGEEADRHAHQNARREAERPAQGDPAIVLAGRELLETRVDDAEEQRRLEALAERDDEGRGHRLLGDDPPLRGLPV